MMMMMSETRPVILYVDDDPDYREAVRVMLEDGGYGVIEADSAEEGLQRFEECRPDLILVDLMMEEVDAGVLFAKEIRAQNDLIPIFMLSSVGNALVANQDTHALCLAGVFQKPVKAAELLRVFENALQRG